MRCFSTVPIPSCKKKVAVVRNVITAQLCTHATILAAWIIVPNISHVTKATTAPIVPIQFYSRSAVPSNGEHTKQRSQALPLFCNSFYLNPFPTTHLFLSVFAQLYRHTMSVTSPHCISEICATQYCVCYGLGQRRSVYFVSAKYLNAAGAELLIAYIPKGERSTVELWWIARYKCVTIIVSCCCCAKNGRWCSINFLFWEGVRYNSYT